MGYEVTGTLAGVKDPIFPQMWLGLWESRMQLWENPELAHAVHAPHRSKCQRQDKTILRQKCKRINSWTRDGERRMQQGQKALPTNKKTWQLAL